MILGRPLMSGTTDYTRWSDAPGEAVTVLHEALVLENGVTLTVTVQTKDRGERDSSAVTATGGTITITSTGVSDTRATGIKDLWRLKVEVTGGSGNETFVHHRPLQPMWEVSGPVDAGQSAIDYTWPSGQTLVRAGETAQYDTPWARTSSEQATFGVRVIDLPTNVTFTVRVKHKDEEDTDDQATTAGTITFSSSGAQTDTVRATALKQFHRYELELSGSASVGHVVHEILEPTWEEV